MIMRYHSLLLLTLPKQKLKSSSNSSKKCYANCCVGDKPSTVKLIEAHSLLCNFIDFREFILGLSKEIISCTNRYPVSMEIYR